MVINEQPDAILGIFNTLSPLAYSVSDASYTTAGFKYTAKVYIWSGDVTTIPATENYTLYRSPNIGGYGIFEISSLMPYFFDLADCYNVAMKFNYTNDAGGSTTDVTSSIIQVKEGYNGYEDALNAATSKDIFAQTFEEINYKFGNKLSVIVKNATKIVYYNDSTIILTEALDAITTATDVIQQSIIPPTATRAELQTALGAVLDYITLNEITDCKYPVFSVRFKNALGTWEYLPMTGKSQEKIDYSKQDYNHSSLDFTGSRLTTDTAKGNYSVFNVSALRTLILNTGFLRENNPVKELFRSRKIYINDLPYIIKDTSLQIKTHLNDKLINYTITLQAAYDD